MKERYELFVERKKAVEDEIQILTQALDTINFKCWYYKTALEAGTENVHDGLEARKLSELIYLKGQE